MNKLIRKSLEISHTQIGVDEKPLGSNGGPEVEGYLASIGLGKGNPWCLAYIYWLFVKAAKALGLKNPLPKTGYCPSLQKWARREGILRDHKYRPKRGDLFLVISSPEGYKRAAHVGHVDEPAANGFWSIEGNTNLAGSREGTSVRRRFRPYAANLQYIEVDRVSPEVGPVQPLPVAGAKVPVHLDYSSPYVLTLSGKVLGDCPVYGGRTLFSVDRWAAAMGFKVGWDDDAQVLLLQGKPVPADIYKFNGQAWAPIRQLVKFSPALVMDVNVPKRTISVTRKKT